MLNQLAMNLDADYITIIYFIIIFVISYFLHSFFKSENNETFIMLMFLVYAIISSATNLFEGIGFMIGVFAFFTYLYLKFKINNRGSESESV